MKTYFASIFCAAMATPVGCLVAFVYLRHVWLASIPEAIGAGAWGVASMVFLSVLFFLGSLKHKPSDGSAS